MSDQLILSKFSLGVGDRFAHQAKAQLAACMLAAAQGVEVIPVWNKSNREHNIIGSEPSSVRQAADAAVKALHWTKPYHVDADHINFDTVDRFLASSDFYTIDVADWIGKAASPETAQAFVAKHPELIGKLDIPGTSAVAHLTLEYVAETAAKYLTAVSEAGLIYRKILDNKGVGNFIPEVSMDETDSPQTPAELLIILVAIADQGIPIQTIAPKFTGRFNKGVDYVGNIEKFTEEFADDLATIAYAVEKYGLPKNLKLSVHSGSDKFSIYGPISTCLKEFNVGVHLKTAGTNWLEELIGLAEAGGAGLDCAKEIYAHSFEQKDALCLPYATVIDIDYGKLPSPQEVNGWTPEQYVSALRHDQLNPDYNSSLRQLLHVGFKVAAKLGGKYLCLLEEFEPSVSRNVTANLFDRHIKPLFLAAES